jgi:hypothetical protein
MKIIKLLWFLSLEVLPELTAKTGEKVPFCLQEEKKIAILKYAQTIPLYLIRPALKKIYFTRT